MKRQRFTLTTSLLIGIALPAQAGWYSHYYQPKLSELMQHAEHFEHTVTEHCRQPHTLAPHPSKPLQSAWQDLAKHWVALSGIPNLNLDYLMLNYRLDSWPDRRALIPRRSAALLNAPLPEAFSAQTTSLQALAWWSFHPELTAHQQCQVLPKISMIYRNNLKRWQQQEDKQALGLDPQIYANATPTQQTEIDYNMALSHLHNSLERFNALFDADQQWQAQAGEAWHGQFNRQLQQARWQANVQQWEIIMAKLSFQDEKLHQHWQVRQQQISTQFSTWQQDEAVPASLHANLAAYHQLLQGPLAQATNVMIGFNNQDGD